MNITEFLERVKLSTEETGEPPFLWINKEDGYLELCLERGSCVSRPVSSQITLMVDVETQSRVVGLRVSNVEFFDDDPLKNVCTKVTDSDQPSKTSR